MKDGKSKGCVTPTVTRIVATEIRENKTNRKETTFYLGDNGVWYDAKTLGEEKNLSPMTIRRRVRMFGHTFKHLFDKKIAPEIREKYSLLTPQEALNSNVKHHIDDNKPILRDGTPLPPNAAYENQLFPTPPATNKPPTFCFKGTKGKARRKKTTNTVPSAKQIEQDNKKLIDMMRVFNANHKFNRKVGLKNFVSEGR